MEVWDRWEEDWGGDDRGIVARTTYTTAQIWSMNDPDSVVKKPKSGTKRKK